MDEHEIERCLRDGLETRAEEADVTAPVADRARSEVGRRRRTRWGVVGAAAAVLVVVGGIGVVSVLAGDGDEAPPISDGSDATAPTVLEGEWRTEYWADVAVDVPADWGYGGAPDARRTACYPEAMVGPDGARLRKSRDLGWVGRPIYATDVCALIPQAWEPTAPYVWLGSDIEPGTYEYDNGYVQETVEVNGSTVTVGTKDADLRAQILATARGGEICMPELDGLPAPSNDEDGDQDGSELTVCAYGRIGEAKGFELTHAQQLELDKPYDDTADSAGVVGYRCVAMRDLEFVVLTTDRGTYVVDFTCRGIRAPDGRRLAFSPSTVRPWAVGGIPATVYGPTDGGPAWVYRYFIGPQG